MCHLLGVRATPGRFAALNHAQFIHPH